MRPRKTILLVDDNEQALSVRKFLIETRGYRALAAQSGEEAIELFQSSHIDLVVSDQEMPRMRGSELICRLKQISPDVPMILLSEKSGAAEQAHEADAYLNRAASTPLELLERIRVMSARKRGPRKKDVQRVLPGIAAPMPIAPAADVHYAVAS